MRTEAPWLAPRVRSWWAATRFHYIAPSFIPAVLGSALAYRDTGAFDPASFLLVLAALVANHAALNMTDDYFDHRHAVDLYGGGSKNPYSGGSGTLTSGRIRPKEMKVAFLLLYAFSAAAGLYLAATRGWPVLAFGLFGMASAYFYTAPPLMYGYRGFGELSLLVNFSLTIGFGSYFVQAGRVDLTVAPLLLPLGFLMFSMIVVNELPDRDADRACGKMNLVARCGLPAGVVLFALGLAAAFAMMPLAVVMLDESPRWLMATAPLPLALAAVCLAVWRRGDPVALAPANLTTVVVHNATGFLLCVVACFEGASSSGDGGPPALMLAVLCILYLPVAVFIAVGAARMARRR